MGDLLDNAVWHALGTHHAAFAETHGRARRYRPDVSPFAGVDELGDAGGWADLAALAGGDVAVLFRDEVPPAPPGWDEVFRGGGHQLVLLDDDRLVPPPQARPLGLADVDAMLALVAATRPGPFLPATVELGGYHGVVEDGRLVAMAGERMRVPGFTEISAVCTDPAVRGRGLAAALTSLIATRIRARGEVPFLHVAADNHGARRVYERLGFIVRREVTVVGLRPPR